MPDRPKPLLNHCATFARDLDRSIEFYETVFALTVKARWTEIILATDGKEQRVDLPGAHLEDGDGRRIEIFESTASTEMPTNERPINHFAFEVDDVASAFETALAAGAAPDTPPSTVTAGSLRAEVAFVRGPDAERIELLRFL